MDDTSESVVTDEDDPEAAPEPGRRPRWPWVVGTLVKQDDKAAEIQLPKNVHFTKDGYQYLATAVVKSIETALSK